MSTYLYFELKWFRNCWFWDRGQKFSIFIIDCRNNDCVWLVNIKKNTTQSIVNCSKHESRWIEEIRMPIVRIGRTKIFVLFFFDVVFWCLIFLPSWCKIRRNLAQKVVLYILKMLCEMLLLMQLGETYQALK